MVVVVVEFCFYYLHILLVIWPYYHFVNYVFQYCLDVCPFVILLLQINKYNGKKIKTIINALRPAHRHAPPATREDRSRAGPHQGPSAGTILFQS